MFLAESAGFVLKDMVDWTASEAGLLAQSNRVLPWLQQFYRAIR